MEIPLYINIEDILTTDVKVVLQPQKVSVSLILVKDKTFKINGVLYPKS